MASDTFTPIMYADDTTLLSTLDDFNGNQITNPNSIQINAELTKVMDWLNSKGPFTIVNMYVFVQSVRSGEGGTRPPY